MTLDQEGFDREMAEQKARARSAAQLETDDWVTLREGETLFVGYDQTEADCEILRYRRVKQKNKDFYQVVLSITPFYAEMGDKSEMPVIYWTKQRTRVLSLWIRREKTTFLCTL